MSEDRKNSVKPSHIVYHVRDGKKKDERYWDSCGVAFEHGDKDGFNVELSMLPVDGRLTLRTLRERPEGEREERPRNRSRDRDRGR